jgi:hypothetical protein
VFSIRLVIGPAPDRQGLVSNPTAAAARRATLAVLLCACSAPSLRAPDGAAGAAGGGFAGATAADDGAAGSDGLAVGDGPIPGLDPGRAVIHRLNNREYDNTIHDLLGLEAGAQQTFIPDEEGEFDNDGDAAAIRPRLSSTDRLRLDQFTTSVRDLEQRVQTVPVAPSGCLPASRPPEAIAVGNVPADYDRDAHATMMIDLMVLALACDVTHVVSFMLDDARSDFVYNFLKERSFTATGSTPGTAAVSGYHGLARGAGRENNGYATINFWFVSKLAELGQKLAALPDGPNTTVLDNSVIWFGSGMNDGVDQSFFGLPLLYLGGGGGVLKTDAHIDFGAAGRRLSDVCLTFIQNVFRLLSPTSFADSQASVSDLLA